MERFELRAHFISIAVRSLKDVVLLPHSSFFKCNNKNRNHFQLTEIRGKILLQKTLYTTFYSLIVL